MNGAFRASMIFDACCDIIRHNLGFALTFGLLERNSSTVEAYREFPRAIAGDVSRLPRKRSSTKIL